MSTDKIETPESVGSTETIWDWPEGSPSNSFSSVENHESDMFIQRASMQDKPLSQEDLSEIEQYLSFEEMDKRTSDVHAESIVTSRDGTDRPERTRLTDTALLKQFGLHADDRKKSADAPSNVASPTI